MKIPLHLNKRRLDRASDAMMRLDHAMGMRALRNGNDGFRAPPSGKHAKGSKRDGTREEYLARAAFN